MKKNRPDRLCRKETQWIKTLRRLLCLAVLTLVLQPPIVQAVQPGSTIIAWGDNTYRQCDLPGGLSNVIAVSAGKFHTLGLKSDHSIIAWGYNFYGQSNVPVGLSGVAVAAGGFHNLVIKPDGMVGAWGSNDYGQCDVPADLSDVIAVAAGNYHSLALQSNGTVKAWGHSSYVPAGLSHVIAIAAGAYHDLALLSNGKVVAWGDNLYGQCNVPADLSDVIAVAAGAYHSLALQSDGTIVAWGDNFYNQCNVPDNHSGVVAIAAGAEHNLALQSNGKVLAWGRNYDGQCYVPEKCSGVVAVAAGMAHSIVLERLPDLIVSSVNIETPHLNQGQDLKYSYALKNIGAEGPAGNSTFDVATYLSADPVLDGSDVELSWGYSAWTYHLAQEWSRNYLESARIPQTVPDGDYYLIVVADAKPGLPPNRYPGVIEFDEHNNQKTCASKITIGN